MTIRRLKQRFENDRKIEDATSLKKNIFINPRSKFVKHNEYVAYRHYLRYRAENTFWDQFHLEKAPLLNFVKFHNYKKKINMSD